MNRRYGIWINIYRSVVPIHLGSLLDPKFSSGSGFRIRTPDSRGRDPRYPSVFLLLLIKCLTTEPLLRLSKDEVCNVCRFRNSLTAKVLERYCIV